MTNNNLNQSPDFQSAINLLTKLDTHDLEHILLNEDIYYSFQSDLISLEPQAKKLRMAEILIYLYGYSFLINSELRNYISAYTGVTSPHKWIPGSNGSINYCNKLLIPRGFAGVKYISLNEPPYFNISFQPQLPQLMDFQKETYDKSLIHLKSDDHALISLPTGSGKTRVATQLLCQYHKLFDQCTTIWVAHTDELCEQAINTANDVWKEFGYPNNVTIYRAWGNDLNLLLNDEIYGEVEVLNNSNHSIIITTPISLLNWLKKSNNKYGSFCNSFLNSRLIIIDEAHRSAAPTYLRFLSLINIFLPHPVKLLGLSATPIRETYSSNPYSGTKDLLDIFHHLIEPLDTLGSNSNPTETLQTRGILSDLKIHNIDINKTNYNEISSFIKNNCYSIYPDSLSLLFTQNIFESKVLSIYLNELGIPSSFLSSNTNIYERFNIINSLKLRQTKVLCNCQILSTGFDAPQISNIFLLRQTQSPVLYKQIIGRGLRGPLFGGTKECNLFLFDLNLPFDPNPNTSSFARRIWKIST